MIHYIQEKDLQIEIFSTMAITNAAVFTMLLMFPVGEGEMGPASSSYAIHHLLTIINTCISLDIAIKCFMFHMHMHLHLHR